MRLCSRNVHYANLRRETKQGLQEVAFLAYIGHTNDKLNIGRRGNQKSPIPRLELQ